MLWNRASLLGCSCIPGCFSFLFLEVFAYFQPLSIFSYSSLHIFVTPGQTSTQHRSCWRGNEGKGRRGNVFFLVERVETEEALNFLSHKNCKYVVNMHKTSLLFCFRKCRSQSEWYSISELKYWKTQVLWYLAKVRSDRCQIAGFLPLN